MQLSGDCHNAVKKLLNASVPTQDLRLPHSL